MSNTNNKFNSEFGYNIQAEGTSKISFNFDTNVDNPVESVLGHNGTQFILVDKNLLDSTDSTFKNNNFILDNSNNKLTIKNYIFEKLVDPSVVGCINCDSSTNVKNELILNGDLPIINKEIIAEFEIDPKAYHSFEIDLVGHRKISNSSSTYTTYITKQLTNILPEKIHIKSFSPFASDTNPNNNNMNSDILEANHAFLDYSCCPCCDAIENEDINAMSICNNSSNFFNSSENTPFGYCAEKTRKYLNSNSNEIEEITQCDFLKIIKNRYGSLPNTNLPNCNISGVNNA